MTAQCSQVLHEGSDPLHGVLARPAAALPAGRYAEEPTGVDRHLGDCDVTLNPWLDMLNLINGFR